MKLTMLNQLCKRFSFSWFTNLVVVLAPYIFIILCTNLLVENANQQNQLNHNHTTVANHIVQGLFKKISLDKEPSGLDDSMTQVWTSNMYMCALHCAMSSTCLSYSVNPAHNGEQVLCSMSDLSAFGLLTDKLKDSPGAILYARSIIHCDDYTDAPKSQTNLPVVMTIYNQSGRDIKIQRINENGNPQTVREIPDGHKESINDAMLNNSYVAVDDYFQLVPLNGQCWFTTSTDEETVTAGFGF